MGTIRAKRSCECRASRLGRGRIYPAYRLPARFIGLDDPRSVISDPVDGKGLSQPSDIAVAPDGTVYLYDHDASRILRRTPDGTVSRVMGGSGPGTPEEGDLADGSTLSNGAVGIAVEPDGTLLVSENGRRRIFRIVDGRVRFVMGRNMTSLGRVEPADGVLASEVHVTDDLAPSHVTVAPTGEIVFASRRAVWKIGKDGRLLRLAGSRGNRRGRDQDNGNGGPALAAPISVRDIAVGPRRLALHRRESARPGAQGRPDGSSARCHRHPGPGLERFVRKALDVDAQGNVYVAQVVGGDALILKLPPKVGHGP